MSEITDKTVCVVDHGLYLELALRLARKFKRVLYHTPWEKSAPIINDCCLGDGLEDDGVERIDDFWTIKNEINCFVFPDIMHGGLQRELITQGFPVWGSGHACELEMKRAAFKHKLMELGLEVGPYRVCRGLDELREYLKDKEDCFVKLSKYRGCMETWHWVNQAVSRWYLDVLAVKFGPLQNCLPFLVEDAIESKVEWGYDGYFAGGKFPNLSAQGPEIKDKCYIASMVEAKDLPEQVKEVNAAMAPILDAYGYANFWSTELRITKDDRVYFIDPCCRVPSPAGEAQMELYGNLPEIIWHGAQGHCIDPEPTARFCVEALIDHTGDYKDWRTIAVPDKIGQWVKLYNFCKSDGLYHFPPFPHSGDTIGAILGIGDTMEEAIGHLQENIKELKDQPVSVHADSLMDALKEIEQAQAQGVEFSRDEMPPPETVLE